MKEISTNQDLNIPINKRKISFERPFFAPKKQKKEHVIDIGVDTNSKDYLEASNDRPELVRVQIVDLLKRVNGKGLFAKNFICAGTIIGSYTGEEFKTEAEFVEYLDKNQELNNYYAMSHNGKIIDAQKKGNFTRYINFSDSQANVAFVKGKINYQSVIRVKAIRDINIGEQMLVNYNVYDAETCKNYLFLNPEDGSQSTTELYQANRALYKSHKITAECSQFGLKTNDILWVTSIGKAIIENKMLSKKRSVCSQQEVTLPFLKKNDNDDGATDFIDWDTFSPLMLACYKGQFDNVTWLIDKNANVNQQQNQSGSCPLFLALEGYKSATNKENYLNILEHLISSKANLLEVHDKEDRSFLHRVLSILNSNDFKRLIHVIKKQNHIDSKELFNLIDNKDNDIFISCLIEKDLEKVQILLDYYPQYLKLYQSGRDLARNKTAFINSIGNYTETEKNKLSQIMYVHVNQIKPKVLVALGLNLEENQNFTPSFS